MAEVEDVLKLLWNAKVFEALELAGKVKDRKGLAVQLTEFAGTLDWLKGKPYTAGLILLKAIELCPEYALAHYNLGVVFTDVEMLADHPEYVALAEREYRWVIGLDQSFAPAHHNLALLYYFTGRLEESRNEYKKAVELEPSEFRYKMLGALLENAIKV